MNLRLLTEHAEQMLKITVRVLSGKPEKIQIVVCDAEQNNTVLTNRYKVFDGDDSFYVRMPVSPRVALVQVYNDANGNLPDGQDKSFKIVGDIIRMPLEKKMRSVDMKNPDVRSFVDFAQGFCYYMGVMDTGTWESRDKRVRIRLDPVIMRGDKVSSTPARISEDTKLIEVSQQIMLPFTVPMRFAIICHEFAHCYLNAAPESETEADLQGLMIYLGLGYPRIEAHMAFTQTFQGAASELNAKRYAILKQFIEDFESHKFFAL
jgi:hypothetical protein